VPGTPAYVAGLINVRGEVHTVLDLGATLDLVGERAVGGASRVLLVEIADGQVGLLVDEVVGVRRLAAAQLTRSLSGRELARGIAGGRTVLLDLDNLLGGDRLEVVEDLS
jgi:purine-binding chemotaxis protein CheW